jgi:vitamin B12 transporter
MDRMIDWSPVTFVYENVNKVRSQGATLAYETRFGAWSAHAAYDWLLAQDQNTGLLLGRRARNKATLSVVYKSGPWSGSVEGVAVGARFDNNAHTAQLGSYGLVNLTLNYTINKALSLQGRIDNLFDRRYELAKGYNTPGFTIFAGVRYTPR